MAAWPRAQSPPRLTGWSGAPSSFFAAAIRTTPAWPLRTTSASASMTRTVSPQPAWHNGHTLGFQTATPGMMSSSGTNRISWFSGLPQLASVALVPVMAVSLMKERRSIGQLEMTGETVDRRAAFVVAIHAKPHRVLDAPLCHRLLADVAVAGGAFDFRADMRGMVELHAVVIGKPVDPLPRQVDPHLAHLGDLLNARPVGGDRRVANHAGAQTGNARHTALVDPFVTELAGDFLADVDVMREVDRLDGFGTAVQEIVERRRHRRAHCRVGPGGLAGQG